MIHGTNWIAMSMPVKARRMAGHCVRKTRPLLDKPEVAPFAGSMGPGHAYASV